MLQVIVLSVLLRFMASDYPFGIFKLFSKPKGSAKGPMFTFSLEVDMHGVRLSVIVHNIKLI